MVPRQWLGKKDFSHLLDDAVLTSNSCLMKHCISGQDSLCAKALKMDNVVQIIIKAVNFMKSKGLNHCQF